MEVENISTNLWWVLGTGGFTIYLLSGLWWGCIGFLIGKISRK